MIHKLYDGAVELSFDAGKHQYRIGGELCPSVTGILDIIAKPALLPWGLKMAGEYLDANLKPGVPIDEIQKAQLIKDMKQAHRKKSGDAADIGTLVHSFCEQSLTGQKPHLPVNPAARLSCESFLDWVSQHHGKVLHAERKIFSRAHYYAGTVDLVAEIDGALTVADIKTSNAIYPEYFLQLAGYDIALAEELGRSAERRKIVRFPKEGGPCSVQDAINPDADDAGFLAALALFRWQRGVSERMKQEKAA
jgi:hypothetical protein